MAVATYWQPDWYLTDWFPPVWFAPADESGVPPEELRQDVSGGSSVGLGRRRGSGPWQDLESVLKIKQHDTEDDVLLMLL